MTRLRLILLFAELDTAERDWRRKIDCVGHFFVIIWGDVATNQAARFAQYY